jgi:malonyl-CoA/methylmalonyl-CoA synthetase
MTRSGETLLDVLAEVRLGNSRPFLLGADGSVLATYDDAARRSSRLAHVLRAHGLHPGDRLALQVDKCVDALMVYLACIRAGVVLLPMNIGYTPAEVEHLVTDAEPRLVVRDADLAALVTTAGELAADADRLVDHPSGPDDLAAVLYTSGTTGRPKGAMLSHRNLAVNCFTLAELWGFHSDDVLLHALPVFHTHGLFVATNCVLIAGAAMVFLPRFDTDTVCRALRDSTVMMGVPTFYTRLLADPAFGVDTCRTVRLFVSGSAPLLASTHAEFELRTGHRILERYGMTETTMLTSNPLHGDRRAGTVGLPLPGVDVRVVGEDGHSLPAGAVGDVEVRGPNVFAGYWRRPDLTVSEFTPDGWFRTGDVGRFDTDGYLHLVGRSKDLVITGGLNVYPVEVEAVLDELPGVLESAVIGVPDPDFGEAVVAVVVAQPGATLEPEVLRTEARARLAGFKVPKQVHVVDALPRNAMGKVEKAVLRRIYAS